MIPHTSCPTEDGRSMRIFANTFSGQKEYTINCSKNEYIAGLMRYRAGALMQDAFPFLTNEEREFLISGTTPEEWNALYPDDEEE